MKKLAAIIGILSMVVLSGCEFFNDSESTVDVELAEDQTKIEELEIKIAAQESQLENGEEVPEEVDEDPAEVKKEESEKEEPVEVNYTGASYITLNSPTNEVTLHDEPVEFKGVVSPNATKIVVTAKSYGLVMGEGIQLLNEDIYRLQRFEYGDTTFEYGASFKWDNLEYGTNEYEFKAYFDDGTTKSTSVTVYFVHAGAEMGKPVVYLYPEETMQVFVDVEPTGGISISDPEIGDGWNVVATPSGRLYDFGSGKVFPYLFWEGFADDFVTPEEGFVMARDEVSGFFDEKLEVLGLNKVEIADFKEFWMDYFQDDPYYFVTFVDQAELDRYAPLTVSPEPDSLIRVFFDYRGLEAPVRVEEQELEAVEREGFAVVEWGGRIYR